MPDDDAGIETAEPIDLVEHRGEEPHVGVRANEQRVADPAFRRFDATGVHEHDAGASRRRSTQLAQHVGDRIEAALRRSRVLADDDAEVRVLEVGDGVHRRGAEDGLARHELVRAVLRARRERPPHTKPAQHGAEVQRTERVERGGIADVGGHGVRTVRCRDPLQRRRRVGHRRIPRDVGPRAIGRSKPRVIETVAVTMQIDRSQTLVAGEALRGRMLAVGRELHQHTTVDMGDEAA